MINPAGVELVTFWTWVVNLTLCATDSTYFLMRHVSFIQNW